MKEFKRFVAGLAILGVVIISVIVAFRLAPETWAVMAGIIFGVVAALPMCVIVVLLVRQRPAPPPTPPVASQPPQIILLHPGAAVDPRYSAPPAAPRMLQSAPPAYPRSVPQGWAAGGYEEVLDAVPEEAPETWAPPPPRRSAAPAPRPSYRILGE